MRVVITKEGEEGSIESPDQDQTTCEAELELVSSVLTLNREQPGQVIELPWQHQLLAGVVTGVSIEDE